jgi:hypothetical protein
VLRAVVAAKGEHLVVQVAVVELAWIALGYDMLVLRQLHHTQSCKPC